jgi:hypothetical protein
MPRSPPPSSLADVAELAAIIRSHAALLAPAARSRFYELVDRELGGGCVIGPGLLARVRARSARVHRGARRAASRRREALTAPSDAHHDKPHLRQGGCLGGVRGTRVPDYGSGR